jgi:cytochrome c
MMRLFSVILGVTTLLSRSGESSQVKTGESRDAQPGIALIEFAPPSPETIPGTQLGEQIRPGYKIVVNTQEYADAYVGKCLNCTNGKNLFASKCAFCHGSDGHGTMAGPPVWGPQSYNIAADMARVAVAAAFIKSNIPRRWGWSLSDDDAYDVAAYVNSRPRPDFPNKVHDWPKGGKPADSPY